MIDQPTTSEEAIGIQPPNFEFVSTSRLNQCEPDACESFAHRIFIQMVMGNFDAAKDIVEEARVELMGKNLGDDPALAEVIPNVRLVNALEKYFRALFVSNLKRVTPEDVAAKANMGPISVRQITSELSRHGIVWPEERAARKN